MNDDFQMIDELKAETRMFKWIDLKSTFMILGFFVFGFIFKESVYSALQTPFVIFNVAIGVLFSIKSPWNKDKMIWQSLILYVRNLTSQKNVYHAVEEEAYEDDIITATQLMYTDKYSKQFFEEE